MNAIKYFDDLCRLFLGAFNDEKAKEEGLHAKIFITFNPEKEDCERWSFCVQMEDDKGVSSRAWVIARGLTPQLATIRARDVMLDISSKRNG